MQKTFAENLKQSFFTALIALVLFFHLIGLRTVDQPQGLGIAANMGGLALAVAAAFIIRFLWGLFTPAFSRKQKQEISAQGAGKRHRIYGRILLCLIVIALVLPFSMFSSRYVLDVGTLILTYAVLAFGLNIVVGFTGLLDLGFAAFYALGAYSFALFSLHAGAGFWQALYLAMILAGILALLLGMTVLRLRGDYFAVVTLGFAEILRIVLLNWVSLTGGPNGISGIPRPSLFGISFDNQPAPGTISFHQIMGIEFEPMQRVVFLYYLALALALLAGLITMRLRHLPLGRAMEAIREDELAAQAVGMNLTRIKLCAYMLAAFCGAAAGAFFASRQGFISPESFTFMESALILAIVVLGGMGHPLGIVVAAALLIGLPELFRDLQDYRMLAFCAGMVLIMILKPDGLFARRRPAVRLGASS